MNEWVSLTCPRPRYNYHRPADHLVPRTGTGSIWSHQNELLANCFRLRLFPAREKAIMINLTTSLSAGIPKGRDTGEDYGFLHKVLRAYGTGSLS